MIESKTSTAVTSTEISPPMQTVPKINISSLLTKRHQMMPEILPIKVEPVRPFTSVPNRPLSAKVSISSEPKKRDAKAAEKLNISTFSQGLNVTSNFNLAH